MASAEIKKDFLGMFDALKGALMLVVVAVHTVIFAHDTMPYSRGIAMLERFFQYGAVPIALFFIIAGYSFQPGKHMKSFIKRQWKDLMRPYFVTVAAAVVARGFLFWMMGEFKIQEMSVLMLAGAYGSIHPFQLFGKVWVKSIIALWFLPTLFLGKLFLCLLERIPSKKTGKWILWGMVVFAVSFPDASRIQLPWFLIQALTAMGFMETGRILKKYKLLYKRLPYPFTAAVFAAYIWCHLYSMANVASNSWKFWMADYITGIGMAVIILRMYIRTGIALSAFAGPFEFIGRYSLWFLCFHGAELLILPWDQRIGSVLSQAGLPVFAVICCVYCLRVGYACLGCMLLKNGKGREKRWTGSRLKK